VCPDADTLKRASAIVQAVSGNRATATDKRGYVHGVKQKLKILDRSTPWAFEYIRNYPRSPFELPGEVLSHAYGAARPINMPDYIGDSGFKLIVAATPYKKMKTNRLDQTHHQDQTSVHGATHATDALVPYQDASPSPTAQPPVMNAGPFAAFMHALMHGVQHMGSQNTGGQFRSRLPLQLENSWGNCLISVPLAEHHTQPRTSVETTLSMTMTWIRWRPTFQLPRRRQPVPPRRQRSGRNSSGRKTRLTQAH